jgi:transcriptional regulator with XRE-family HTH domain
MQEETAKKVSAFPRLEKLRIERGLTWDDLAHKLGVSVSLLYQVRRGASGLSERTLHRLTALENDARTDFAPAASPRETNLREPSPIYGTPSAASEYSIAERLDRMEAQLQTLTQLLGASLAASAPHAEQHVANERTRKAG